MKRVLHLGKYYHPYCGGIETVMKEITDHFNMSSKSLKHFVLCFNDSSQSKIDRVNNTVVIRSGVELKILSQPISFDYSRLLKRLLPYFDLVHLHMPNPLVEYFAAKYIKDCPIVVTYHSDIIKQYFLSPFYSPIQRKILEQSKKILVPTKNHITYSKTLTNFSKKCEIIPFSIQKSKFELNESSFKLKNNYSKNLSPYFLFIGRLVKYKGVEHLIHAMKEVGANLIIVGTGPLENKLKKLSFNLGLSEKIKFFGKVDNEELIALLHQAKAVILPSVSRAENFGMVQLEAFACKTPTIVTDLKSGVPAVGINNKTTLIASVKSANSLAKKMQFMLSNPDEVHQMSKNAYSHFLNNFESETVNNKYEKIYNEVLQIKDISKKVA